MFQTIGERIEIAGVYSQGSFIPKKFRWNSRVFPIKTVTLTANIRDGQTKKRMYAVLSGNTLYRLLFNRDSETWTLEEIWVE